MGPEELEARHLCARHSVRQVLAHLLAHQPDLFRTERLVATAERLVLEQAERLPVPVLELTNDIRVPEADGQARLQLGRVFLGQVVQAADHARQRVDGLREDLEALRHVHLEAEARVGVFLKVLRRLRRRDGVVLGHTVSPGGSLSRLVYVVPLRPDSLVEEVTTSASFCGSWYISPCPAPGTTSSSAPGTNAAISFAFCAGAITSSAPVTKRVGHEMFDPLPGTTLPRADGAVLKGDGGRGHPLGRRAAARPETGAGRLRLRAGAPGSRHSMSSNDAQDLFELSQPGVPYLFRAVVVHLVHGGRRGRPDRPGHDRRARAVVARPGPRVEREGIEAGRAGRRAP